jgi:integrase
VAELRAKQSRRQHKQSPYVFPPTKNFEFIQQASVTDKHFKAALVALKIRARRQYNCRHTYATMCLMAGMNLGFIANPARSQRANAADDLCPMDQFQ